MSEHMRAYGTHRTWSIVPRVGTGPDDKWTILASPVPGAENPAAAYDDGQYSSQRDALMAVGQAERSDDGTNEEDPPPCATMSGLCVETFNAVAR